MGAISEDARFMRRALELALLAEREGNLLHGIGRVVFGSSDDYGGAGPVLTSLPSFFQERIENTEWLGPIMPGECDPLHERLLRLEKGRRGPK